MKQKELEEQRKKIGLEYKSRRIKLLLSAREIVEASDNTLTLKTIYKFENGGSSHGDTRIIYENTIEKLELHKIDYNKEISNIPFKLEHS